MGPQVGEQPPQRGDPLGAALLGILIYIALPSTTFAPGAIVALVHDVLITKGIFSFFGLKFDLPIMALLTIVGTTNDTIVVYDRIREELQQTSEGTPLEQTVNHVERLPVAAANLDHHHRGGRRALGVRRSDDPWFSIAMTIGVVVGTYSSVFVASPIPDARALVDAGRGARSRLIGCLISA